MPCPGRKKAGAGSTAQVLRAPPRCPKRHSLSSEPHLGRAKVLETKSLIVFRPHFRLGNILTVCFLHLLGRKSLS